MLTTSQSIPDGTIEDAVLEQIQHQVPDVGVRCQTPGVQLRLVRLRIAKPTIQVAGTSVT